MFHMYYMENMSPRIIKVSHTRGQNFIGIPKNMAVEAGLDKCDYAFIWRTGKETIHIKGIKQNGYKERDIQGD